MDCHYGATIRIVVILLRGLEVNASVGPGLFDDSVLGKHDFIQPNDRHVLVPAVLQLLYDSSTFFLEVIFLCLRLNLFDVDLLPPGSILLIEVEQSNLGDDLVRELGGKHDTSFLHGYSSHQFESIIGKQIVYMLLLKLSFWLFPIIIIKY